MYYKKKLHECTNYSSKFYGQLNILLEKNKNSNILPCGKLPLLLASDFKNFFIDKIDKMLKGFKNCHISEDIFSIPNVLAPVTNEQKFTFIKKMNEFFCRNDSFGIKTFDSEHLEKIAEYCCDLVIRSFKSGTFSECEKIAFVRPIHTINNHIGPHTIHIFCPK